MRKKLKDDFEKMYLRFNIIQKAINTLSQERVDQILNDIDFKKCTRYIARQIFHKHKVFLTSHGFWQEDLDSIAQIFGLSFFLYDVKTPSKHDESMILMRYVNQRFQNFIEWGRKKFGMGEKIYEMPAFIPDNGYLERGFNRQVEDETVSIVDQVKAVSEDYNELLVKIGDIRTQLKQDPEEKEQLLAAKSKLTAKSNFMKSTLMDLNKIHRSQRKADKVLTAKLSKRLDQEFPKHADTLAYYATSKHVPYDMRKKAKAFCKKYGIDYIVWAQKRLASGLAHEEELSLG